MHNFYMYPAPVSTAGPIVVHESKYLPTPEIVSLNKLEKSC